MKNRTPRQIRHKFPATGPLIREMREGRFRYYYEIAVLLPDAIVRALLFRICIG
jgi:hypothetical protein